MKTTKNLITFLLFLFCSFTASAQQKGEVYISPTLSISSGSSSLTISSGSTSQTSESLYNPSYSFGAELGFFAIDNLRTALTVGYSDSITKSYDSNNDVLNNQTSAFIINPNIAYYIRIFDNLFLCPEVGVSCYIGSYSEALTTSIDYNADWRAYSLYIQPLQFETRVNERIAIGVSLGSLSYESSSIIDKETDSRFTQNTNGLSISSSFWFRFYL